MGKQIKQQTDDRWFAASKPGTDFKSPINWNPFKVKFAIADNIFVSISKITSIFLFCSKLAK